jgi:glycosyltransferase involved in cell wall biosynthesis
MAERRMILMVGTARDGAGGIASVISTYAAHGLFSRWLILTLDSHVMGSKWRKGWAFVHALASFFMLLIRGRVGLLHLHTSSGPSFWRKTCFACLAFLFRRPVLLHIHSGEFMSFYENSCGPLRRRVVRFIFERSTRVIALSPSWRARYLSFAPCASVVCIPNPVIVANRQPQPRQLRRRAVLFLGKICVEKGVFDLIEAWPEVRRIVVSASLVIAGDGDLDAARGHIERLGLAACVETPGWVSGAAKAALLANADVCVLPSYYEGMPMSVLEAFGAGMPCVASTVGGIPDMMTDGVEGRLIKPGDVPALAGALIDVLSREEAYAHMSRAALARFTSDYSAEVVMPKLESLYGEMAAAYR